MTATELWLYAACVRAELLARGTLLEELGPDEAAIRDQLGIWIPLLWLQQPTVAVEAECLVIPLKDQ